MRSPVRAVAFVGLICLLCHVISAQNWHFSNGWESGKRSSGLTECQFRPQVKALVNRIIEEEITRLQRVCTKSTYLLPETRSYLQAKNRQPFEPDQ
ncbi:uncharacterized protein LOC135470945 [Liolophura sinensis]|uniref:uncharacterized protein LOC135470945 n=1 Tax=Liolophura sinensis TaxID=3198878 RepID=UPI003159350A